MFGHRFNERTYSDFTITDGTRELYVHRLVLAESPYFDAYFTTKVGSADRSRMTVPPEEFEDLSTLIEGLYHGKVNATPERVVELIELADRYLLCDHIKFDKSAFDDISNSEPDWDLLLHLSSMYKRIHKVVTPLLSQYRSTIPEKLLDSHLMRMADHLTLEFLATTFNRYDLIDRHRPCPDMDSLLIRLQHMSVDALAAYFTPEQIIDIREAHSMMWAYKQEDIYADIDTIHVVTMHPFVAYRADSWKVDNDEKSLTTDRDVIGSSPDRTITCNTIYIDEVGFREVTVMPGERPGTYTLKWDFHIPLDTVIRYVYKL